jgi:LuxR family transcriptional regulator, maltose regulon positive regulatory protein
LSTSKKEDAAALLAAKIAPPRTRRWVITRQRLVDKFQSVRDCTLIRVQAPEGYGKTSLLARFRREWLGAGAYVGWLSLDANDGPARFVEALLLSAYSALGKHALARLAEKTFRSGFEPREAIAALLGDLANAARPTALFLDDVHALPEAVSAELLPYLVFNLPPNVHLIVGTRRRLPFSTSDLLAHGELAWFDIQDLSFRLDETRALLQARCGSRVDVDTVARVHERVEGWPMGLQLLLVDVEREGDPAEALRRAATSATGLRTLFADVLLPRLDPDDVAFLTAVAPLEQLEPYLCAAVTGRRDCRELLERLRDDTPMLHAAEASEWLRLHAACRDVLLRRFDELPEAERSTLHWRAAEWLHAAGMHERAAHHALAAGRHETAYAWIAQALFGLLASGRVVAARDWLERLPESTVMGNDRLRLVAAWLRALSSDPREAFPLTEPLIGPDVDPSLRFEALQVRGAAAHHMDDLLTAGEVSALVGEDNPFCIPVVRQANAVLRAVLALSRGDTVGTRMELAKFGLPAADAREDNANYYAEFFAGLSYLLDARPIAAARRLEPALSRADGTFGRRSPAACLLATVLAAALWEQDQPDAAEATLANRLDIIERTSVPEAVALAYLTLARVALERRELGRVQDLLEGLYCLGVQRRQPRMIVASLAEQVRVQTMLERCDACALAAVRLREQREAWRESEHGVNRLLDIMCGLAEIRAALCARDDGAATAAIERLQHDGLAEACPRDRLELLALRGMTARLRGEPADALRREIDETAAANGLVRLLRDFKPSPAEAARSSPSAPPPAAATAREAAAAVVQGGLLTAKESEILALLARNYSNKEIARALDVGPATVKWHLRNLFAKLNVGSRRHAVQRARMLQLVGEDAATIQVPPRQLGGGE